MAVERIHATHDFSLWKKLAKPKLQESRGTVAGKKAVLVLPDTFMNKSGHAVAHFIPTKKGAGNLVLIHDDLDLPLGTLKISHGRSSGGHNGVESVIKALKTKDFVRIRIGVSRKNAKGVAVKPSGEDKVLKFLLGKFSGTEMTELKKVFKRVVEAVEIIAKDGHATAMNQFNS